MNNKWNISTRDRQVRLRGMTVILSDHCLDQISERVFGGIVSDRVVEQAREYVKRAKRTSTPPSWVNGTPRDLYLVSGGGRVVFPLAPVAETKMLAVTCLHRDHCEPDLITRRMQEAGLRS